MFQKIEPQLAPSSRAASSTSWSCPCRAATKMMKRNGVHCQTSATISVVRASQVLASQSMLSSIEPEPHQEVRDHPPVVEGELPQEGDRGGHEQHRHQEDDAPAADERIAVGVEGQRHGDDGLEDQRDAADDDGVAERRPELAVAEQRLVVGEARPDHLVEADDVEALPDREDAWVERDHQQIDDRWRHQQVGHRRPHRRAAPPQRPAHLRGG